MATLKEFLFETFSHDESKVIEESGDGIQFYMSPVVVSSPGEVFSILEERKFK